MKVVAFIAIFLLFVSMASAIQRDVYLNFLASLDSHTKHSSKNPLYKRVGVGYNANLDMVTGALEALEDLGVHSPLSPPTTLPENVTTLDDLTHLFRYSFENGVAVERVITNPYICKIVQKSTQQTIRSREIGGNAGIMATHFKALGATILPGFSPGPELSLHYESKVGMKFEEAFRTTDAPRPEDVYHFIWEFSAGEIWGDIKAPRSNRFISHCDTRNSKLPDLEIFHATVWDIARRGETPIDLLALSGFHLLEAEPETYQQERLQRVVKELNDTPKSLPIHVELASTGTKAFRQLLSSTVLPAVDSIGLNEQELLDLVYALNPYQMKPRKVKRFVNDLRSFMPANTGQALLFSVMKVLREKATQDTVHKLGRMHLHTLHYHIIAEAEDSDWNGGLDAVATGSGYGTAKACGRNALSDPEGSFKLLIAEDPRKWWGNIDAPESLQGVYESFKEEGSFGARLFTSPVVVCRNPASTVGLGDAISSMALMHSRFTVVKGKTDL